MDVDGAGADVVVLDEAAGVWGAGVEEVEVFVLPATVVCTLTGMLIVGETVWAYRIGTLWASRTWTLGGWATRAGVARTCITRTCTCGTR